MIATPAMLFLIMVAAIVAFESYFEREWGWFAVALATMFCCGLAIYFRILGAI